jgi:pyruvate,water dikinase
MDDPHAHRQGTPVGGGIVSDSSNQQLTWDQPGPGSWRYDGAHNDGPKSGFIQAVFPDAIADGFRAFTERYGLPLSHIEVRFVHGFGYDTARIAGVPAKDGPPPPTWLLRILTRIHPEFRRRERNARAALGSAIWRQDLERWESELRPARIAANRGLQAVDPEKLDDPALAAHVEAAVDNLAGGMREHFMLIGASTVPVGLHLMRSASPSEAFAALSGAARESTGATVPALRAIAAELARLDEMPTDLDQVRQVSPAAARALDEYLTEYGQRLISTYDVTGLRLVEMPDAVMRSIVAAGELPPTDASGTATEVDPVLADARRAFASRDDHSGVSGIWPMGLVRRALLVAGERLVAAGRLLEAEHVFDCTPTEVSALLRGSATPIAADVAARWRRRNRLVDVSPPARLGTDHGLPDPAAFPPSMQRMTSAIFAAMAMLEPSAEATGDGEGIGTRTHRGRAVVATRASDAVERLEPGDVLVTTMTTPAFNCILPIVGGLVTVHGGQFSHAGIAARELGIPAVLGVPDALSRIPDGAMVEVDPIARSIAVIDPVDAAGAIMTT